MQTLPPRLQVLAALMNPAIPVFDVGCDHGYLGLWCHRFLKTPVTLIDCQEHILKDFKTRWGRWYPEIQTECLRAEMRPWKGTLGNVVVAGMGPDPIFKIAQSLLKAKTHTDTRLVISPEKKPFELLMRLQETGWIAETLRASDLNPKVMQNSDKALAVRETMGGLGMIESPRRTRFFFRLRKAAAENLYQS